MIGNSHFLTNMEVSMKLLTKTLIVFTLGIGLANASAFKPGKWVITGYSEIPGYAGSVEHSICVKAMVWGKSGTFYGISFPLSGNWFQKGNDIHINSLYFDGQFASTLELTRIDNGLLTGYWQDFGGSYTNYLTAKLVYKSPKCDPDYYLISKNPVAPKGFGQK
jgi:hypothetical protein